MKYEIIERGHRLEAIGAHSGYRIRISTLSAADRRGLDLGVVFRLDERIHVPTEVGVLLAVLADRDVELGKFGQVGLARIPGLQHHD